MSTEARGGRAAPAWATCGKSLGNQHCESEGDERGREAVVHVAIRCDGASAFGGLFLPL